MALDRIDQRSDDLRAADDVAERDWFMFFIHGCLSTGLDDSATNSRARVARGLAAVVGLRVHDNRVANDGVFGAADGDVVSGQVQVGFPIGIGLEISEVAGVALVVRSIGQAMLMLLRVVMPL